MPTNSVRRKPVHPGLIVAMLIGSSAMMATAWLGHLRFHDEWSFLQALVVSWLIVLPEYVLNTIATRSGYGIFSGAQMAAIHLSSGVICVALVSRFILGEDISGTTMLGFAVMLAAIVLIQQRTNDKPTVDHAAAPDGPEDAVPVTAAVDP